MARSGAAQADAQVPDRGLKGPEGPQGIDRFWPIISDCFFWCIEIAPNPAQQATMNSHA